MHSESENHFFSEGYIEIQGAREHNLKNIDVKVPREKLVVITGVSGSGKSSLAFDTIYAEGQRRYMESFSAYARQFIGNLERPDVDKITGLSPVISIEQKTVSKNPRSTVGTVTEIYDLFRLLYARAGKAFSYVTGKEMVKFSESQILEDIYHKHEGQKIFLLAPMVRARKGHYRELFEQMRRLGYVKARVDGHVVNIEPDMRVDRYKIHDIEIVIDRLGVKEENRERLYESLKTALKMGQGVIMLMNPDTEEIHYYSKKLMCSESGIAYDEPAPNLFSFNSPYGACPVCNGLGVIEEADLGSIIPDKTKSIRDGAIAPLGTYKDNMLFKQVKAIAAKLDFKLSTPVQEISQEALNILLFGTGDETIEVYMEMRPDYGVYYDLRFEGIVNMIERHQSGSQSKSIKNWAGDFMAEKPCPECGGARLKKEPLFYRIAEKNIYDLVSMSLDRLGEWLENVEERLTEKQLKIGTEVLKEIRDRLSFLLNVGLGYLTLDRPARTLSGGESQRIRLATQIGSQLTGVLYILDEPTIGLHQRDNQRLITALKDLVNLGNSVMVVEHDKDLMLASDYIVDLGPGAGKHGGELVDCGSVDAFLQTGNLTAAFLNGQRMIEPPAIRRSGNGNFLELKGATGNNLKNVDVTFPLGLMICVTGVSGSGKSTLINRTLYPILNKHFFGAKRQPLGYTSIEGLKHVDKVIEINQAPIGRTPRSNPATYIGVFSDIRKLFAEVPEAKIRGYKPGRFSFNVKGGRCETCQGGGMKVIEMNFLPDVHVKCETCLGKRYNRETLEIRYKGKSINDVLEMTVDEAVLFFEPVPNIYRKLKTVQDVGLGYISLGQSSTTLSGGEAQRVKLASELSKKDTGNTFYILDEPTTGLHFNDVKILLDVLNQLVEKGNTVLIIEHNLDVIKVADHIIDIGPEGGEAGGEIIAEGTPEQVVETPASYTGQFLKDELMSVN